MKAFITLILATFTLCTYAEIVSYNLITNAKNINTPLHVTPENYPLSISVTPCKQCKTHELIIDKHSRLDYENKKLSAQDFVQALRSNPSRKIRIQYNKEDKTIYYMSWNSRGKDVEQ